VNYTDRAGNTRVERYRVSRNPDAADPGSRKLVLAVDQPYSNHNGGCLASARTASSTSAWRRRLQGDPHGNGQNPGALLGKLLRLDVDVGDPLRDPPRQPLRGTLRRAPEIWAIGLRNPWRFCFDPKEHRLIIADVGQNHWEEIDVAAGHGSARRDRLTPRSREPAVVRLERRRVIAPDRTGW